jgi:hypothetical protein
LGWVGLGWVSLACQRGVASVPLGGGDALQRILDVILVIYRY